MNDKNRNLFPDDEDEQASAAELLTLNDASVTEILSASYSQSSEAAQAPGQIPRKAEILPLINDGSIPLENSEHERFLQFYLQGSPWHIAYQKAGHPNCTGKTASEQAARMKRRPEIQVRLRFLLSVRSRQVAADDADEELSDKEILRGLKQAWRSSITNDAKIAAAKLYKAIKAGDQGDGQRRVDPAVMMAYIRDAAKNGKTLAALAGVQADEKAAGQAKIQAAGQTPHKGAGEASAGTPGDGGALQVVVLEAGSKTEQGQLQL